MTDERRVLCRIHIPKGLEKGNFTEVEEIVKRYITKLKIIEEHLAMVECVYCFLKSDQLKSGINPKVMQKIDGLLNKIRKAAKVLVYKAKELNGRVTYDQLGFMKTFTMSINNCIAKFHKEAGCCISYNLGAAILKTINDKAPSTQPPETLKSFSKYEKKPIEPLIFDKEVSIISFLAEFKQSIIKYEQNLKSFFESKTATVNANSNVGYNIGQNIGQKIAKEIPINQMKASKDTTQSKAF